MAITVEDVKRQINIKVLGLKAEAKEPEILADQRKNIQKTKTDLENLLQDVDKIPGKYDEAFEEFQTGKKTISDYHTEKRAEIDLRLEKKPHYKTEVEKAKKKVDDKIEKSQTTWETAKANLQAAKTALEGEPLIVPPQGEPRIPLRAKHQKLQTQYEELKNSPNEIKEDLKKLKTLETSIKDIDGKDETFKIADMHFLLLVLKDSLDILDKKIENKEGWKQKFYTAVYTLVEGKIKLNTSENDRLRETSGCNEAEVALEDAKKTRKEDILDESHLGILKAEAAKVEAARVEAARVEQQRRNKPPEEDPGR